MKKNKVKKMGKKTVGVMAAVLLCTAGAYQTYSYFTEKEEVTNVFTVGDFDISMKEPEWNPADGDGVNMYPGYTVYKNPTVKNMTDPGIGEQPCYLQMRMKIQNEKGEIITDQKTLDMIRRTIRYDKTYTGKWDKTGKAEKLQQGKIPGYSEGDISGIPMVNPDFQEVNTGKAGEYLFQYKGGNGGIMRAGEETVLFTNVVIPTNWGNKDMEQIGRFQIIVSAEAIQSNGFASAQDAFAALGQSVEEGTVYEES